MDVPPLLYDVPEYADALPLILRPVFIPVGVAHVESSMLLFEWKLFGVVGLEDLLLVYDCGGVDGGMRYDPPILPLPPVTFPMMRDFNNEPLDDFPEYDDNGPVSGVDDDDDDSTVPLELFIGSLYT